MASPSNLLFVFPDQLSAQWLGCSGNAVVQTPRIDRFATEACRFGRAYSNSPVCTPYRGILMTGRYPTQSGVLDNGDTLPTNGKLLAEAFNEAGYRTAYVGKWHLSGAPHCNRWVQPEARGGFREFVGWESHHVDHMAGLVWERPDRPIVFEGHETDGLTGLAMERLSSLAAADEPFCMFLSYQAPHPPSTALSPYQELYDGRDLCGEPNADPEAWYTMPFWGIDYDAQEFRRRYFSEISQLDAAFGRILDHLDELGLSDETIVVFTSDHGEMAGCHSTFGKGVMYEESIRVPLLIRMPGEVPRVVDAPVSTIDLYPTLLNLCGIEPPAEAEGRSLRPLIEGGELPPRPVCFEYGDWIGIMDGTRKLCADRASGKPRSLYDLAQDPYEQHCLLHRDKGQHEPLAGELRAWMLSLQSG